ncbi:hypothetical protein XH83_33790 [Bradyrhizobium sp. CCBAU 53351]|uniref:hypothetical protein n=1 Tax=Bradyrhizobium sp. CCBAU 53351 TaxID=1325114 RepID=UPI001887B7E1|nr:hypothetical protein [Bradyrhizobium sp. CCBAU 53351]QOZ79919.1 hypothetical protein XH83_33790 [Bradyrhizobium sp. CCBAU 53351]
MPIKHEYRDARVEAEPLLRAAGVRPSAILEFLDQFAPQFVHVYDPADEKSELVYRGTDPGWRGFSLAEAIATLKDTRPHYFYAEAPEIEQLAEAAFGASPSLAARGRLRTELGTDAAYREMAERWGSDGVSLKPGVRPGSVQAKQELKAEGAEAPRNNPWHPSWRGPDRLAAQTSIIRTSTKLAAGLAKAAGVTLAGTPLRS